MKTIGRILIILAVFGLVMGVTYGIVNARGSSALSGAPGFEQGGGRLAAPDGAPPGFANGTRPEFPGRERNEFRGGWLIGAIKNSAIIGLIVALNVVPKSWMQKRRKAAQVAAG